MAVHGGSLTKELIKQWAEEFPVAFGKKVKGPGESLTRQERYSQQLNTHFSMAPRIVIPALLPSEIQLTDEVAKYDNGQI